MPRHVPSLIPWLLIGVVVLICYGSLYPFNLKPGAHEIALAQALQQLSWERAGRGDQVSNVLLYVPLGFCLFLWLEIKSHRWIAVLAAIFFGALLSYCIEVAQVYISMRVPSTQDVTLNTFGTMLGVAGAIMWRALSHLVYLPRGTGTRREGRGALVVLLLWVGWRFAPYTPRLSLAKLKAALQPLFHPDFSLPVILRYLVCWLIVAQLLFRLVDRQRGTEALLTLIAAVLMGRLILADQGFNPSELLALLVLLPALVFINWLPAGLQGKLLVLALGVILVADRSAPFDFSTPAQRFDLWPFLGWIEAGMPIDAAVLLEKSFLYGALIWMLKDAGLAMTPAIAFGVGFILCLELLQVWQPSNPPSITNPVLAFGIGMLLRYSAMRPNRSRLRA